MPVKMSLLYFIFFEIFCLACFQKVQSPKADFYFGADLSYINELQDCGASFHQNNTKVEPYHFFAQQGNNLLRLRLWHKPSWTSYSTLTDVKKSIKKAKAENMQVLLDFHYSDTWADPAHQIIPAAWANITDEKTLGDSLYNYTKATLVALHNEKLLPDLVQIGNETNSEILMAKPTAQNSPTNWQRQIYLINKGLQAVKDFNTENNQNVLRMLHIAQPENARSWFEKAKTNGLADYEYIGLSYYPNWSKYDMEKLKEEMVFLKKTFSKELMIVETGYPYSYKNFDSAGNVLGNQAALKGYTVSPEGQLSFMIDLTAKVKEAGGKGVVYWEPAWVSTSCKTLWSTGSHWENAAFFDASNANEALPVFKYYKHKY
jgi:arabinogalactan endo-1,4-beta-galactosidase